MRYTVLVAFLVVVMSAGLALAQDDAVLLRYSFEPGQQLRTIEMMQGTVPIQMQIAMPGAPEGADQDMTLKSVMDTTTVKLATVDEVDETGAAICTVVIEYLVVNKTMPDMAEYVPQKTEFQDGKLTVTGGAPQEQLTPEAHEKLEKLLNTAFVVRVDTLGRVETVGADFHKAFSEVLGGNLSGLKINDMSRLMGQMPEQPVQIGDSWSTAIDPEEGAVTFEGQSDSTLTAIVDEGGHRVAKISTVSHFKMEDFRPAVEQAAGDGAADDDGAGGGGLLEGMNMTIGYLEMHSAMELSLDLDLGQVVRAAGDTVLNMDQEMSMDLGALMGGPDATTGFTIDMKIQIRDAKMNVSSTTELVQ